MVEGGGEGGEDEGGKDSRGRARKGKIAEGEELGEDVRGGGMQLGEEGMLCRLEGFGKLKRISVELE